MEPTTDPPGKEYKESRNKNGSQRGYDKRGKEGKGQEDRMQKWSRAFSELMKVVTAEGFRRTR